MADVSVIEAIILGLVQGLTEFLPISSSAHLRVVGPLVGSGADPGAAFTAITQIGTEAAVVLYFRRDIAMLARAWWASIRERRPGDPVIGTTPQARLAWFIGLGSLPIIVLGLLLQDYIETTFRSLYFPAVCLIVFGLILGWADKRARQKVTLDEMNGKQALIYGFAQAAALVPGVSRSGGTITAGLLMGFTRAAAARYSFLLALPAVLGSGFYQVFKSLDTFGKAGTPGVLPTVVATLIAFVVGYLVIIGFLRLISTHSFSGFVWYRLGFGALILVLLATKVLPS